MQLPPASIALRAAVPEDELFMQKVYFSTRAEEMKLIDWTDEQKQAFLEMQFTAQKTAYLNDYLSGEYFVILKDGEAAGRLIVERTEDTLLLIDLAILPEYRNLGIGTYFLEKLKTEATEKNQTLRLHVENFNPAHRLYERLGFAKVAEHSFYWRMEWNSRESVAQAVA